MHPCHQDGIVLIREPVDDGAAIELDAQRIEPLPGAEHGHRSGRGIHRNEPGDRIEVGLAGDDGGNPADDPAVRGPATPVQLVRIAIEPGDDAGLCALICLRHHQHGAPPARGGHGGDALAIGRQAHMLDGGALAEPGGEIGLGGHRQGEEQHGKEQRGFCHHQRPFFCRR
jgi:hypothetical protein